MAVCVTKTHNYVNATQWTTVGLHANIVYLHKRHLSNIHVNNAYLHVRHLPTNNVNSV